MITVLHTSCTKAMYSLLRSRKLFMSTPLEGSWREQRVTRLKRATLRVWSSSWRLKMRFTYCWISDVDMVLFRMRSCNSEYSSVVKPVGVIMAEDE